MDNLKIDLTPDEFATSFKNSTDGVLLDVRTPDEFNEGHLPGALNIDIRGYEFHELVKELDTDKTYFVYCKSGGRSSAAIQFMQSIGFTKTHNLVGGITAWRGEIE